MNDLFGTILGEQCSTAGCSFTPSMDVEETDTSYVLMLDLPGVDGDELHIDLDEGVLHIHGTRHEKKVGEDDSRRRVERTFGEFSRKFRLPEDVNAEEIVADYDNGVADVDAAEDGKEASNENRCQPQRQHDLGKYGN